jgi:RNA polymerase sigma-70 factor (ECF subfamily)
MSAALVIGFGCDTLALSTPGRERAYRVQPATENVTQLLLDMRQGVPGADTKLLAIVYRELRRIAGQCFRYERPDHTLQPTVLVHEAYLRLVGPGGVEWQNRSHFFAVAAQTMRRILVDYARTRKAQKRGGPAVRIDLPEALMISEEKSEQVLLLDEALSRLARFDPRQSRIVEMRFFGGLTEEEIAEVLGVSARTVKRDWSMARAWLLGEMTR